MCIIEHVFYSGKGGPAAKRTGFAVFPRSVSLCGGVGEKAGEALARRFRLCVVEGCTRRSQLGQMVCKDHEGTAPYRDFCILVPVAQDAKLDVLTLKEMVTSVRNLLITECGWEKKKVIYERYD